MSLKKVDTVVFDPSKKAHREAVAAFLQRGSWSDSPIRFAYDPAFGSVADMVQSKLLRYYLAKDRLTIPAIQRGQLVGTIQD